MHYPTRPVQRASRPVLRSLLLLITVSTLPVAARAQDASRFLEWSYRDAVALGREAVSPKTLIAAGGIAVLAPVSLLDQTITHEVQESYRGPLVGYLRTTNELGGPNVKYAAAGIFGISLLTKDERFQDAAFTSLQSVVYAGVINYGLKYTVGRFRPEDELGAFTFAPFSGKKSFPSGHTNTAFAVLTPWAMYYPSPITKGLLVAGAGGTALARISMDKHWATDVIAGGTIGFLTAYWLTKRHTEAPSGGTHLSVTPSVGTETVGLSLRYAF